MTDTFHFEGPLPPVPFIGRERELTWLRRRLGRERREPEADSLWIVGEAGIGKTALVAQFLEFYAEDRTVVWFNCVEWVDETPNFQSIFGSLTGRRRIIVVFDGAEAVSEVKLVRLWMAAKDRKAAETVIFTSRAEVERRDRYEQLVLKRMPELEAEELLRAKVRLADLDESSALRLAGVVNGNPEAMSIVAAMAQSMSSDQLRRVLSGKIYDADEVLEQDGRRIARFAKPVVMNASEQIAMRLKKEPKDIHKLTPRQYEELIAELLRGMSHEVALTKATRDGGKDILASMKTEIGEILCLVDTKKYRANRKIGVGMVRTLYGTLSDYQATSAMLVTTSSYSPEARAMQEKHKYQLSLKDYADVAVWIQKYGNRGD